MSAQDNIVELMARAAYEKYPSVERGPRSLGCLSWEELGEWRRQSFIDAQKDALTAAERAGYVVVPVEPTEEMCRAAEATGDHWYFDKSWAAMLSAFKGK
jgi:hypothetical protein